MRNLGIVLVLAAGCHQSTGSPTRGADLGSAQGPSVDAAVAVSLDGSSSANDASASGGDLATGTPDLASAPDLAPPVDPNAPFPTSACPGAGATEAQLAALFAPGASEADFAAYTISGKSRTCTAVTGCSAWSDWTPAFTTPLSPVSPFVDEPRLLVDGTAIELELVNQFCTASNAYPGEWYGATCTIGSAGELSCGTYEWDLGEQWGGSGGTFCTPGELYLHEVGNGYTMSGTITPSCFDVQTQQGPAIGTQYAIDIHGAL